MKRDEEKNPTCIYIYCEDSDLYELGKREFQSDPMVRQSCQDRDQKSSLCLDRPAIQICGFCKPRTIAYEPMVAYINLDNDCYESRSEINFDRLEKPELEPD